ncbi:MAG: glycosyl hydrolase 53 family protein [Lachnospiraceae bacterium]|nr:glycosyl hydrolase 53 family protein [Lachnospiraceae bacterium]
MKNKILAFTMAAVLAVGLMAGCGKKSSSESSSASESVKESSAETDSSVSSDSTSSDSSSADNSSSGDEDGDLAYLISKAKNTKVAEQKYTPVLPTGSEEAEIFIEPIEGLSDDFYRGVDISSVIAEEQSGIVYKDWSGKERDIFEILADAGVNYVRVRVWNNPYDKDGNGYGGGNCDVEKACEIGRRAAEHGMKLLIDFHYSDFWADPSKQQAPLAWARKKLDQKVELINEFTQESIAKIIAAGADVGLVQIGNEINKGVCGVYEIEGTMQLLDSASKAVRTVAKETGRDIKIIVHYTQLDNPSGFIQRAERLKEYNIDYDILGASYYVYWHGTMENMNAVLKEIKKTYGVDTCIMETAYPYTAEDGDSFGNNVNAGEAIDGYPADVQGQAKIVRDVMYYANDAGALGVFYWEPAWTPVGTDFDKNTEIWEKYGSGWASSYATYYDPKDAGEYYGGCSWDNQAMFDFNSQALASLNVFKWVKYGATSELKVMSYESVTVESSIGDEVKLPDKVRPFYNDPSVEKMLGVKWDQADIDAIDINNGDTYYVGGTTDNGDKITATVKVMNVNLLKNGGFDEGDVSMWKIEDKGAGDATDVQKKAADATSGENALHFYSLEKIDFDVTQTVKVSENGNFEAAANIQGGDVGDSADIYLYVIVDGKEYKSDPVTLAGWVNWQKAKVTGLSLKAGQEVTVGMHVTAMAKGWGTIDDIEFYVKKETKDTKKDTAQSKDTFTFYYYYEGKDTLIMNIWDNTNLEFTKDAKLNNAFSWTSPLAELTAVSGKPGWYQTTIKINGSTSSGGLSIYEKSNSGSAIFQMDPQWSDDNGKAVWRAITSKEKDAYAVKDWAIADLP